MFGREAVWSSYVGSIVLSILFAILVNFVMYFRLKKIDMVESLKSVE
jgi:putative ABC transport system permease protein